MNSNKQHLCLIYSSVPVYFVWLKYLSWMRYAYEILVVNQWRNVDKIDCPQFTNSTCLYRSGKDVIKKYNMNEVKMNLRIIKMVFCFNFIENFIVCLERCDS